MVAFLHGGVLHPIAERCPVSKITTVKAVRIPKSLLLEVERELASRNNHARDYLTLNEWLVRAIANKVAHCKRSRRKRATVDWDGMFSAKDGKS